MRSSMTFLLLALLALAALVALMILDERRDEQALRQAHVATYWVSLDGTFDANRDGIRLEMDYASATDTFIGRIENPTDTERTGVRVEVRTREGARFGTTEPLELAPGEIETVTLEGPDAPFEAWSATVTADPLEG